MMTLNSTRDARSAARCLLGTVAAALLFVGGCSDSTAPTPFIPDLTGVWDVVLRQSDTAAAGATCSDTGSLTFAPQAAGYVGLAQYRGTCVYPTFHFDEAVVQFVVADAVHDGVLTFTRAWAPTLAAACHDTARATAADGRTLTGHGVCERARVTWTATRGVPVASITLSPDSIVAQLGAPVTVQATLRSANGAPLYLRTIAWAVDQPAVATLVASSQPSGTATITPLAAGTLRVSATVDGRSTSLGVRVASPNLFTDVHAGDANTCALSAAGAIYCWGLGPGARRNSLPTPLVSTQAFTSLAMGRRFACALAAAGAAYCFGGNDSAQFGNGTKSSSDALVPMSGAPAFASLTAGWYHACGLTALGAAWCWGSNEAGQLGTGSTGAASTTPVAVAGGRSFTTLSAGAGHTCGIDSAQVLWCWGANDWGQLGDSSHVARAVPTRVVGLLAVQQVSVGAMHTCAITAGGVVLCWGLNLSGQLGFVGAADRPYPGPVSGAPLLIAVSAAQEYTCGLSVAHEGWCWGFGGANPWGQLGTGQASNAAGAVKVTGGLTFTAISAGLYTYGEEEVISGGHSCASATSGLVYCWGLNGVGQLGTSVAPSFSSFSNVPVKVAGQP